MKRATGFTCLAFIVLGLIQILSPRLEAQGRSTNIDNQPRDGVCFYMDEDYRGNRLCVNAGESQRNVGDRYNDQISSIQVFGRAQVVVYENDNFSGASRTFTGDVPNLRDWNDRITSFQVAEDRQYGARQSDRQYEGQYGGRGSSNKPRNGACFYMDEDYRGNSFCLNTGESQRNVQGRYNDQISSVRVFGGARVVAYENENFSGARRTIAGDVPNLGNFNDKITSIEMK
jgi:hypothetical protein